MTKRTKVLLLSTMAIMLCVLLITTGTFALFTDGFLGTDHLQAGSLNVSLRRTALRYSVLDASGYLKERTDNTDVDFTGRTHQNIFGLGKEKLIVPRSFFEADMELINEGNVAFDYVVKIFWKEDATNSALAEQLRVCVDTDGKKDTWELDCKLSECKEDDGFLILSGVMDNTVSLQKRAFTVRIEFLDDLRFGGIENDDAQNRSVSFDLIVSAVQHVTDSP